MPELLYRRRLPHWQTDHAIYFVTWRLATSQPELTATERDTVVDLLKSLDRKRYSLIAYVVMNDHVHVLFSIIGEKLLPDIIHSWKSFMANRLQRLHERKGRVWQPEYFDRVVRDERELSETIGYIAQNPFKRWRELVAYRWLSIPEEF